MLSILGGLVAVAISVLWIVPTESFNVCAEVLTVIKGSVALGLIFGGLIAVVAGISALKEKAAEKEEQAEAKQE